MIEKLNLDSKGMITIINRVPIFKLLSEQDKRDFLKGKPEVFVARAGETILAERSFDKSFYVIVSGAARSIQKKDDAVIEMQLQAGDFIGEVAFCTNEQLLPHVKALRDSVLIKITNATMTYMPLIVKDKIKSNIIKDLANRVDNIQEENAKLKREFQFSNTMYQELKSEVEELRAFVNKINSEYPHIKRRYELFSF